MKTALWLSLGLNALLLLSCLLPTGSNRRSARPVFHQWTNRQVRLTRPASLAAAQPPKAFTIEVIEPFHWSQLESSDYRQYIANLRQIGCPEPTVRDILVADVEQLFSSRVKELVDTVQNRFWELIANEKLLQQVVHEKEELLDELRKERDRMLEELLGVGALRPATDEADKLEQRVARRQFWDFLPEPKQEQCLAIEEKFRQRQEQLAAVQSQRSRKEFEDQQKLLQEEQGTELERTLSTEEAAEYKLRRSRFAELRFRLAGFVTSEEELRRLVQIQDKSAEQGSNATGTVSEGAQNEIKNLLGAERFTEFQRAQDTQFQEFYDLADRLQLPSEMAVTLYDLRRGAEAQAHQLRADTGLTEDERQERLTQLRAQTEQSLGESLGTKIFKTYRAQSGYWLQQIAQEEQ